MEELPKTYYRVSIKGLILNENGDKFLIIREDNGYWELPGGGLDRPETAEECLKREVKEELGIQVVGVSPYPSYVIIGENMNGKPSVNVVYEAKLANLDFKTSNECQEIKFVTPAEALEMNSWRNVKELAGQFDSKRHTSAL